MTPADQSLQTLLDVIRTLNAALETEREEAAKQREESRKEIARLVTMVEGLTLQLDQLLKDRDEERRADPPSGPKAKARRARPEAEARPPQA